MKELIDVGQSIWRALDRMRGVFAPGSGRRRRAGVPSRRVPAVTGAPGVAPFAQSVRDAVRSSRYGAGELLPGDPGPLVRPYVVAFEERQRQRERRRALLLALDGVDVGPERIHGVRVPVAAGVAW